MTNTITRAAMMLGVLLVVGASLAWAYVDPDVAEPGTTVEVWVLGEPVPATVRAEALWDPKHERARS